MIAQNLAIVRKNINSNAASFAKEVGIPYTTFIKYERGERKPSFELLEYLVDVYNVNLNYIFSYLFLLLAKLSASTATIITTPVTEPCQNGLIPSRFKAFLKKQYRNTPINVPGSIPFPPAILTPPITAAAMESISSPDPVVGSTAINRIILTIAARPHIKPEII